MECENEQWKSGGDCTKCRRQSYCGTKCKEKKNRETEEVNFIVSKAFTKATKAVFGDRSYY